MALFVPVVIGQSDYKVILIFRQSFENRSKEFKIWICVHGD